MPISNEQKVIKPIKVSWSILTLLYAKKTFNFFFIEGGISFADKRYACFIGLFAQKTRPFLFNDTGKHELEKQYKTHDAQENEFA